jgi:hypothetical protein
MILCHMSSRRNNPSMQTKGALAMSMTDVRSATPDTATPDSPPRSRARAITIALYLALVAAELTIVALAAPVLDAVS